MADSNLTVEMVITDRFGTEITVISDPIVIFDDLPIIESVNFTGGVNFGNTITLIPNVVGGDEPNTLTYQYKNNLGEILQPFSPVSSYIIKETDIGNDLSSQINVKDADGDQSNMNVELGQMLLPIELVVNPDEDLDGEADIDTDGIVAIIPEDIPDYTTSWQVSRKNN